MSALLSPPTPTTELAAPRPAAISLSGVGFAYGTTTILQGIDFDVPVGQFTCLLGPSGCGKSTLLRLLAGLERPGSGSLRWSGRADPGPGTDRAVVFQDYALFPWLSLRGNVALAIRQVRPELSRAERRDTAEQVLGLVGLGEHARRFPFQLSGGMQQRGAIARALALGSPLLLMDEPFGALDPVNRARLQDLLLDVWGGKRDRTIVFVTHDVDEALLLADRIVVLGSGPGRIIADLTVDFPRPRSRRDLLEAVTARTLRERIAALYRRDVVDRLDSEAGDGDGI